MGTDRLVQVGQLPRIGEAKLHDHQAQVAYQVKAHHLGDEIAGASVQITGRIAALARPAEILVSRTVKDLVTGTGLSFTERGRHELTGLPDEWPLFAVAQGDQAVRPARR